VIRVGIVDDQAIVRQGIESLLALSGDVEVAWTAPDGDAAVDLLDGAGVDVLLLDLQMPGRDGIATLRALSARGDLPPTLVLTTFDDPDLVLGALRAGARGYLLKDVNLDQLLDGIKVLAAGGTMHLPSVTERLLQAVHSMPKNSSDLLATEALTGRESDVLGLMANGLSNAEIAQALDLAVGTVKNHVSQILLKLGVRDRTQAVIKGLERGVI
jgi:DNA-binding NarL/FixJ family response regulator